MHLCYMASLTLFCWCIPDLTQVISLAKKVILCFFFLSPFCGLLLGKSLVNSKVTVNHFLIMHVSPKRATQADNAIQNLPSTHTNTQKKRKPKAKKTTPNTKRKYPGFQTNSLAECMATSFFSPFWFWTGFKCWKRYKTNHSNNPLKEAFFRTNKWTLPLKLPCLEIFKRENKKSLLANF